MSQISNPSKARILNEFKEILAERQNIESEGTSNEQEAQPQEDSPILETTSPCSPDSVGGLADLQLEFDRRVAGLTTRLTTAHRKIEALQGAIGFAKLRWIAAEETQCNHLKTRVNALKGLAQTHTYEIRLQALLETLQNQESQVDLMSQQLAVALQQVQDLTVKAIARTSQDKNKEL